MRLLFLTLLLANLVMLAWLHGVFGDSPDGGREPSRLSQQIEPDRIRVLTETDLGKLRQRVAEAAPRPTPQPEAPAAAAPASAAGSAQAAADCVEFGDFLTEAGTARARDRLAALKLGERVAARSVQTAGWYMVYLPAVKTRAEVDRRAGELRDLGIRDVLVIADNAAGRFSIALGSFRDPELAKRHLADLAQRGVTDARVAEKPSTVAATRFRITGVDAALRRQLDEVQKDFPQERLQSCAPPGVQASSG
jgi:cell division protein FtsN